MKKSIISLAILLIVSVGVFYSTKAMADLDYSEVDNTSSGVQSTGATNNTTISLTNPLTGSNETTPIPELVNRIATMAIGLSGVMALLAFVYGGVLYLMAGVNLDFMKKGKEIMKWAVFGLVIIFSSYAVVNFVLTSIVKLK